MVGKTALNKERYHLNGGPFQTFKAIKNQIEWKMLIKYALFAENIP